MSAIRGKQVEWTLEVIFQPPPVHDSTSPVVTAQTITATPQPSSRTMHEVLCKIWEAKDRKGKGKVVTAEEAKWNAAEKEWLDGYRPLPVAPPENVSGDVGESSEDAEGITTTTAPETRASDDSPYLLLLSAGSVAPAPVSTLDDNTSVLSPVVAAPSKPPPKLYYSITPTSTLRAALCGSTIIEFPTLELWHRECFLRARAKGQAEIIAVPVSAPIAQERDGAGGRGRGRGGRGGRGGSSGRGGREGHEGGRHPREAEEDRVPDSGWGKRKKIRPELETLPSTSGPAIAEAMLDTAPLQAAMVMDGLVDYGSD